MLNTHTVIVSVEKVSLHHLPCVLGDPEHLVVQRLPVEKQNSNQLITLQSRHNDTDLITVGDMLESNQCPSHSSCHCLFKHMT